MADAVARVGELLLRAAAVVAMLAWALVTLKLGDSA
jgi:hypothetical protein